jgi:putative ABC transport system permease protein
MREDEIIYSVKNMKNRKLRSFLSVLSILIGIAAIFALISFGFGLQDYINKFATESGARMIFIMAKSPGLPGADENFYVTKDEMDFVGKIKGVEDIAPMYFRAGEIKKKEENYYYFIIAYYPEHVYFVEDGFSISVTKGRNFDKGDLYKAVLGYNYLIDGRIFDRGVELGDKVEIQGKTFDVIGFYEEVGNPGDDAQIYITPGAMEAIFPEIKDKFGYVMVNPEPGEDPNLLGETIQRKLRKYKNQDEGKEDFFVQTYGDIMEVYGNVITVISSVLVLIALISMAVAFVNIMNTMYTSVLERTREIGVMKAIGAKNSDIMFVFIFESGLMGTVGGIAGIILGYLISVGGGKAMELAGYSFLQPSFPWYLTAGCLVFAFITGSLAGFLPSLQASRLEPVEALRYE